jgi:hypothetical protein
MRAALFLVFLAAGILCLVGGLLITRLTWRSDIEPFSRRSRFFQIALHPERYASPSRLSVIRWLNLAGTALILCAVIVVVFDVALTITRKK